MPTGPKAYPRTQHVSVRPRHFAGPMTMNGEVSALMTANVVTSNPIDCSFLKYVGFGFIVSASTGAGVGVGMNIAYASSSGGAWYDALANNTSAGEQFSDIFPVAATSNIVRIWRVVGPWARIKMNAQAGSRMQMRNFKWFGTS